MRRTLTAIILSVLLVLSTCITVSAAEAVTAEAVYDTSIGAIVVSGEVTSELSELSITLEVMNVAGETVYLDQMLLPYSEEDSKSYEFAPIVLHLKNATGDYTIKVSAEDIGNALPIVYKFNGADIIFDAMVAANKTIVSDDALDFRNAIGTYHSELGIDKASYDGLSPEAQGAVNAIMLSKTYTVPTDIKTDDNIDILSTAMDSFRSDWDEAIRIGQLYNASALAAVTVWLNTYGDEFSEDIAQTPLNEAELYAYVLDAANESSFVSRIKNGVQLTTMEEVRSRLYEQALLTIIETRHHSESKLVFDKFPTMFGINTAGLSSLSNDKRAEVYEEIKGNYPTCSAAGSAFNALIADKKGTSGGDSYGSSGGSYGGGKITVGDGYNDVSLPSVSNTIFPDVPSTHWVSEAVTHLKNKGVINGDSYGNFNPQNSVTRAEFAKMVVAATNIPLDAVNAEFSDVGSGDWFYPYVNAAKAYGLIKGDAANCFNPYDNITREDMAVILYRAYKINENMGYTLSFSDSSDISDYAKEAVAFLNAKGIVNGVGDGIFAPKKTATRAEAAQMIYNAIK